MPQLLVDNNIDLVCIFATWPETYSYTLTECYMAHIPILTFDIGAIGERVKNDKLGWIVSFNTKAEKILEKIQEVINYKEEYSKVRKNFKEYKFKSLEEMQEYYEDLYKKASEYSEYRIANIYRFMEYKLKTKEFEFDQYQSLYGRVVYKYEKMRNTKLWKIAKRIKSIIRKKQ